MILDAAFELARTEGFQALTARSIAKKVGCSTQPIFCSYENMDLLKEDVKQKIVSFLGNEIASYRKTNDPFLDMGLGYVNVSHTDPLLFKAIYIDNILNLNLKDLVPDPELVDAVKKGSCSSPISDEQVNQVATISWIFAHGLASLIATGVMEYDEEKIMELMTTPISFQ